MTKVPVNQIIPFSTVDGPGSRTSVFLQKCNLACGYCHNPETQNLCNGCGVCVGHCPEGALTQNGDTVEWNEEKCVQCNTCIAVCPRFASPKIRWMDAPAVMKEVEKNLPFIRGITVSGGECSLYPEFLLELFTLAKAKGLTCLCDSNGTVSFSRYPELMRVCDGVMLDVKAWSPQAFRTLTGGDNDAVRENLLFLSAAGKLEEVRVVYVEGHVDAQAAIRGIAQLLGPLTGGTRLLLISFRPNGVRGAFASFHAPSVQQMQELKALALSVGFRNIVVK